VREGQVGRTSNKTKRVRAELPLRPGEVVRAGARTPRSRGASHWLSQELDEGMLRVNAGRGREAPLTG
jgi:hypothetical protein